MDTHHRRLPALALALGATLSCGAAALDMNGRPPGPPDETIRTGYEAGEDYYVWHCYEGSRVIIHQHTSFFSRSSPVMERRPCSDTFPLAPPQATAQADAAPP